MASPRYLVDTSVFARLVKPGVTAAFSPLAASRHVALCSPVLFELGFSARDSGDHASLMKGLGAYPYVPVTEADHGRSVEIQGLLVGRGQHRAISVVDALVAAVAETRSLIVLHYDADLELIAQITGQGQQWIVPRGTAD